MYLRDTNLPTLGDVSTALLDRRQIWSGSSTAIDVLLWEEERVQAHAAEVEDPDVDSGLQQVGTARFGDNEVVLDRLGMQTLAQFYDVPHQFLARVTPEEQQFILTNRIQRTEDRALVLRFDTGIREAYKAYQTRVEPMQIVDGLMERDIMPEHAQVVEWFSNAGEFRLDVIVPETFDRGIGGDRQVGDLTYGGLRIGMNRKQNLAPWVQPYLYRLVCTNGMEVPDLGMKVDARGATSDDIVSMLLGESRRAMERVEDDIRHYYDLRTVKVDDDRTGLFRRMAREQDIPERTIGRMENTLADALLAEEEVTMFHLLNHLTNQANDPNIRSNYNARRALERAGGEWVNDHASRCAACHSRLN